MLQRSLMGAILICAIVLARALLFRRLPRRVVTLLWTAAALFLLLPVQLRLPVSVYGLLAQPARQSAESTAQAAAWLPLVPLVRTVRCLLLAGLALLYLVATRRLYRGARVDDLPGLRDWLAQHPLMRPLQLRRGGRRGTPLCGGLLVPVIVLPETALACDAAALDCILTHEYLHICHFDPLWKLLYAVCACVHWYNPAVWLMLALAGRDLEYACDAAALDSGLRKREYGQALLRLQAAQTGPESLASGFALGELRSRISRIVRHKRQGAGRWLLAGLLALALLLLFATLPVLPQAEAVVLPQDPPAWLSELSHRHAVLRIELEPTFGPEKDPYSGYILLDEASNVTPDCIKAVSQQLQKAHHPQLLRITEEPMGGLLCVRIRVYNLP